MIYFVQHGQSAANAGGVTMAHAEIPLSDRGRRQALLVAALLDVVPPLLLSSTDVRAVETARPFSEKTSRPITQHSLLHEFSALDTDLLEGMLTAQRQPMADAFWEQADPDLRHGSESETFREFSTRVSGFAKGMPSLPRDTVLFGHGVWFARLCWELWGFSAVDADVMREFRRFQRSLPMPNCAVYGLEHAVRGHWRLHPNDAIMHHVAAASAMR